MSDLLIRERRDDIEIVTINRPDKRNAINLELVNALHEAFGEFSRDRSLLAVVLTGAGDHFLAGADIAALRERRSADALESINGALFRRVEDTPVPVIAAIKGYAVGGGCELAMACDIRVAGRSATLGQPEVSLGIIPGAGGTHRLPRLVGLGRAKELIFTGRLIDAGEALAMGLVNHVVADAEVLDRALEIAGRISRQGALAIRLAKVSLNTQRHGLEVGQTLENVIQAVLFDTEDKDQRMTKFLERRKKG